jgi:hypothetical protein
VDLLRQKCLEERLPDAGGSGSSYSSLSNAPEEWSQEEGKPCSGERLLLMFDRWGFRGCRGSLAWLQLQCPQARPCGGEGVLKSVGLI